ncbi:MAG TPA: helicase-associated domain-containing protein [Bacilli bacterium]
MKYADILRHFPEQTRRELTQPFRQCGMDAAQTVPTLSTLRGVFQTLVPLAQKTLALIVRTFGGSPFAEQRLIEEGRTLTAAEKKVGATLLRQAGILFSARKSWGETVYFLPLDLAPAWYVLCHAEKFRQPPIAAAAATCGEPAKSLLHSLFVLLADAAKRKPQLTKQRMLQKKDVTQYNELLLRAMEKPDGDAFAGWGNPLYPEPLASVLQLAFDLRLMREHAGCLIVREEAVYAWFDRPADALENELLAYVAERVMRKRPEWQQALFMMLGQPERGWFAPRALAEALAACGDPPRCSEQSSAALTESIRRLAVLFCACGFMEQGAASDNATVYRWKMPPVIPLGSADRQSESAASPTARRAQIYVQSDLEIVVPPEVSYAVKWRLEKFADRCGADWTWTYRLQKNTMISAYQNGLHVKDAVHFLTEHGATGVPANVRDALYRWWDEHNRLEIMEALLLRCKEERDTDMLAAKFAAAKIPHEKVGAHALAFPKDAHAAIQKELQRLNLHANSLANVGKTSGERPPEPIAGETSASETPAGKDVNAEPLTAFGRLETKRPTIQDAYPGLRRIPKSWLEGARSYHFSTMKNLLQTAIDWGAYVRLKQAGQEVVLIPEEISGSGFDWEVVGRISGQKMRLSPANWNELQLILPGINDKYML